MNQLIEKLTNNPEIMFVLLFWPFFLWLADKVIHKIMMKKEVK